MSTTPESNQHARGLRDFGAFQAVPKSSGSTPTPMAVPPIPQSTQRVIYATQRPHFTQAQQSTSKRSRAFNIRPRQLEIALRSGISLFALIFLASKVPWSSLPLIGLHLRIDIILVALILEGASVVAHAFQWHRLLRAEHIRFDLADLIKVHLVSIAFSHLLPTHVDGDTIKATYIGKCADNPTGASSATVLCRVTGFLGMLCLAIPALVLHHERFTLAIQMWFILLSLGTAIVITGALLISVMLPEMIYGKWLEYRLIRSILRLGNALCISFNQPRALLAASGYSALCWICSILGCHAYALALGYHLPLSFYCVAVPLVVMVSLLPVSLNGLGLREAAFVYIFMAASMPIESAFSLALLVDIQLLIFSVLGGYHYFTLGRVPHSTAKDLGHVNSN